MLALTHFIFVSLNVYFSHHVFLKVPPKQIQLAEVGPRFELKRALFVVICSLHINEFYSPAYEIRQGTIEQTEAEREWVLSHYSRTAKKRSVLSGPYAMPSQSQSDQPGEGTKKRVRR